MIHKSTTEKQKKQLHDSKGDNEYIQLLHSGEEYFIRLKKNNSRCTKRDTSSNLYL